MKDDTMKKTLLEKAMEVTRDDRSDGLTPEGLEITQAWLDDKVSLKQVIHALKSISNTNVYTFLAIHARELYQQRKLIITQRDRLPNKMQEEGRLIRTELIPPPIFKYEDLMPVKVHWTQRPENQEKLKRVLKKMIAGKKRSIKK